MSIRMQFTDVSICLLNENSIVHRQEHYHTSPRMPGEVPSTHLRERVHVTKRTRPDVGPSLHTFCALCHIDKLHGECNPICTLLKIGLRIVLTWNIVPTQIRALSPPLSSRAQQTGFVTSELGNINFWLHERTASLLFFPIRLFHPIT